MDIPLEPRALLHLNRFLGLQIAFHRAFDGDDLRPDIGLDDALCAHGDALCVSDRALDLAANQQFLVCVQLSFET